MFRQYNFYVKPARWFVDIIVPARKQLTSLYLNGSFELSNLLSNVSVSSGKMYSFNVGSFLWTQNCLWNSWFPVILFSHPTFTNQTSQWNVGTQHLPQRPLKWTLSKILQFIISGMQARISSHSVLQSAGNLHPPKTDIVSQWLFWKSHRITSETEETTVCCVKLQIRFTIEKVKQNSYTSWHLSSVLTRTTSIFQPATNSARLSNTWIDDHPIERNQNFQK